MDKEGVISICIATHNTELYIKQCLDSIKKIEYEISKEIIIIDDCSSDNTPQIIEKWIQRNQDIPVIFQKNKKNLWPGGTYNKATKLANGEYITFLDGDDFLIKESFKEKIKYFNTHQDCNIVYWNGLFFENNKFWISFQNDLEQLVSQSLEKIQKKLYTTIPMLSISTTLISKDFFLKTGGFDENIWSNDRILNIKIFKTIKSIKEIGYIKTPCFAYRIHGNNISKDQEKMIKLLKQVVDKYHPKEYKKVGYANIYFFASLNYIRQEQYKKSRKNIKKSLQYNFSIKRSLLYMISIIVPQKIIQKIPENLLARIKKIIQKLFQ